MIRKENWMKRGARVDALGKQGTITTIAYYAPWVHFIRVRLDGCTHSGKYHPTDVKPVVVCSYCSKEIKTAINDLGGSLPSADFCENCEDVDFCSNECYCLKDARQ